ARFKLAILARMAFGGDVPLSAIECQGITRISKIDFEYARALGCTIRLLGVARRAPDGPLSLFVRPMLISRSHLLAKVDGSIDAVIQEPVEDKRHLPFVITLDHEPNAVVAHAIGEMLTLDFMRESPLHLLIAD